MRRKFTVVLLRDDVHLMHSIWTRINYLDEQLQKWYADYGLVGTRTRFKKKEQELKEHIEGYTLDIIRTKENKFLCNNNAHTNGFAYKWTQNTKTRPFRPTNQRNTKNDETVPNLSSASSLSSSQSTI